MHRITEVFTDKVTCSIDFMDDPRKSRYYARRRDHHLLFRRTGFRSDGLDGFYDIHAFNHFPKYDVPTIEPRRDRCRDEKLVARDPRSAGSYPWD